MNTRTVPTDTLHTIVAEVAEEIAAETDRGEVAAYLRHTPRTSNQNPNRHLGQMSA